MIIHKEGYQSIGITALVFGLVNIVSFIFISNKYPVVAQLILWTSVIFFFFILSFFRIPGRPLTTGEEHIVCPADGKVVVIEEVTDTEYFKDKRIQVSIFMSPVNVHVNRCPVSGKVVYSNYHKGKYLVAWHPKSSTENERHSVVIKNDKIEILVKQIAGALAKRIVNYLKVDAVAAQSDEMGFIKFGSRVDVLLPIGTTVNVQLNQKVKGGVTVLGTIAHL